ncbi:MAG: hypothetical protein LH616_11215 [Ilumatobacteraceae bacterium]|nr:hypothetical protein [Ilumatobacteraceae bacterium]
MTAVGELLVASAVEPWQAIGLQVQDDVARIGGIALRFVPVGADGREGVVSWGLVGSPTSAGEIDGLATHHLGEAPEGGRGHALDIVGFDHLVVMTSSIERTCGAIEAATGEPLKRIREAGAIRQGFHRLGELIIEVVESPQVTAPSASFWGFVWNLADLHETCDRLGPDVISLPKSAVQPGRFIASFRAAAGLGLPLALMTPPLRS